MLHARWQPYMLHMRRPSKTSRDTIIDKLTYLIILTDDTHPGIVGRGEAPLFKGLSAEDRPDYEERLDFWCRNIDSLISGIPQGFMLSDEVDYSSVRFGMECALSDLENGGVMKPFNTADDWRIPINGLVWMGSRDFMLDEARKKLEQGYRCVKFKVGGIDFEEEFEIIASIRKALPPDILEIRLDANGGFTPDDALPKLRRLATLDIHSIEQPIKRNNWLEMKRICEESPIPIALDEELIGMTPDCEKQRMLETIMPAYIILKPSLCGGFAEADKWIETASSLSIGWWATSALESDIGLNAIARWVSLKHTTMPQGLGTGQLYTNNIPASLHLSPPFLEPLA